MEVNKNVFAKKSERKVNYEKVDIEAVRETIPKGSYKDRQLLLIDHMVESRWRFLHIPVTIDPSDTYDKKIVMRKMVEISKKAPNEERMYLNKNMNWIEMKIDPIFDNFVVEQYFYYTEN